MVNIEDLAPGMRVKIVDKWTDPGGRQEPTGFMDKWLGTVMTVRGFLYGAARMEEDIKEYEDGWFWYPEMLDYIADDDSEDFPSVSESDFLALLYKGAER